MLKAQTIRFTLSCLQGGVKLGRSKAKALRAQAEEDARIAHAAEINRMHAANLAATWRD
jgi:hypothetical protein